MEEMKWKINGEKLLFFLKKNCVVGLDNEVCGYGIKD